MFEGNREMLKISYNILPFFALLFVQCVADKADSLSATDDRTVYQKLSVPDIINTVDTVLYDFDAQWPHNKDNDNCFDSMNSFAVYWTSDISRWCPTDTPNCNGVAYLQIYQIFVSTDESLLRQYEIIGHEFIHHIGLCFYGNPDTTHQSELLWKQNDKQHSIEALVNQLLWEETR